MTYRRDFLKTTVAGIAAAGFGGGVAGAAPGNESGVARASGTAETLAVDVLVVGAGPAGVPAAIAAARTGARVILAEQDFVPGGAPVNMFVSMICGGPQVGLFREMHRRLNAQFDLNGIVRQPRGDDYANRVYLPNGNWWYLPSSFVNVLLGMIGEERNIDFKPGLRAGGVLTDTGANGRPRVCGVRFANPGGKEYVIKAPVTIDATGTGLLADLAGCECRYGRDARSEFGETWGAAQADDKVQRVTWMYISQRIKPGAVLDVKKLKGTGLVENSIDKWVGKGAPDYYERNTGIYLHWGATVECRDTRDPLEVGDAQLRAFATIRHDMDIMAASGFAVHLAPKIGVREVRRVLGEYVVTLNDLYSGSQPEDTIALSTYGIDAWGEEVPDEYKKKPVKMYGIPYRSLVPRNTEGLLTAGKIISATHLAMSSLRVQPIVASIGTAAGVAAAMAAAGRTGVRDISISDLRTKLKAIGTLI